MVANDVTAASMAIPKSLRVLLLYIEPFFTVFGILLVMAKPEMYTSDTTRSIVSRVDPDLAFVFTQLAGGRLSPLCSAFSSFVHG